MVESRWTRRGSTSICSLYREDKKCTQNFSQKVFRISGRPNHRWNDDDDNSSNNKMCFKVTEHECQRPDGICLGYGPILSCCENGN